MTIRVKSPAGLRFAYKPSLRRPRTPEMTFIVRSRYRLVSGPLAPATSPDIPAQQIDDTRKLSERAANDLAETSLLLGQGNICGDRYEETDDNRVGEVLYPSDFADYKLKVDLLLRGRCHPARSTDTECEVGFQVGLWKKTLKIVGHRVWVDRAGGGKHTDPTAIGSIAVDYAHAYGGPGFANNPVGKGHVEKIDGSAEDLYQPPRSQRSAVRLAQQLPNVLHADGKTHKDGLAAGFGPLNPSWEHRRSKLGKRYDQQWLDERAPYFAADMDGTYFNAAPPDQQVDALRGDEDVVLTNLHPRSTRFVTKLPGVRVRAFVRDSAQQSREIPMRLDTLFVDVEDESLYLTWRGHTPVQEEDLTDVEFGLVVTEPLAEAARPASEHLAALEAFAADPVGMKDAFPPGFMEFAKNAERYQDATDAELEALGKDANGDASSTAAMKELFGPLMKSDELARIDEALAAAGRIEGVDPEAIDAANARAAADLKRSLRGGGGDETSGVGLRLPVRDGEKPVFPIGNIVRAQEKKLLEMRRSLPAGAPPEAAREIDAALEKLRTNPQILETDPHYRPYREDEPPPVAPGPGADLLGRDLSDMDLAGADLSGADLQCAILSRTNLRGANLAGAKLGGARLNRADLTGADLTGVDLTSTSMDRVIARSASFTKVRVDLLRVSKCDLREAAFLGAEGMLATFTKSDLEGASFMDMDLLMSSFDECALAGAKLGRAKLAHVRFDKCRAKGISLEGAELGGTSFHECEMMGAIVSGARGRGAIFLRSGLQKAVFQRANLRASHFYWVDAAEADFSRANLPGARFDRAILRQASFERANLINADFRKAVLTKTSFRQASLFDAKLTETAGVDVNLERANTKGMNAQRSRVVTTKGSGL